MEAFGLAAGVLEVAGFGAEVGGVLWKCARDIRDAKTALESIATEVETTASTPRNVGTLLSHADIKALHTEQLVDDTEKVLRGCSAVFLELKGPVEASLRKITQGGSWQRTSARLQWTIDKSRLIELRAMLERYRAILHLMLTIPQFEESRRSKNAIGIEKLETQIKDVLLSNKHLSDSNKSLSDTIASLVRGGSTHGVADVPPALCAPVALMSIDNADATMNTGQTEVQSSGPHANVHRGVDDPDLVKSQLQSCMDAARGLAGSFATAMDAWDGQTSTADHGIQSSLKLVLQEIGRLPPSTGLALKPTSSHVPPTASAGRCVQFLDSARQAISGCTEKSSTAIVYCETASTFFALW